LPAKSPPLSTKKLSTILDGPIVRIAGLDSAIPFSPPQEEH